MKLRLNYKTLGTTGGNTIDVSNPSTVTTTNRTWNGAFVDPWFKHPPTDDPFEILKGFSNWSFTSNYQGFSKLIKDDVLTLALDVPGVKPEDSEISITEGTLTFRGKRIDSGLYTTASIYIDDNWDLDTADAEIEYGVLTIKFKIKDSRKPRSIKVKVK